MSFITSKIVKLQILKKSNFYCWYCGISLKWENQSKFYCNLTEYDGITYSFHIEHQIPKSKTGNNTVQNLVASCESCNCYKGDLNVLEFKDKIIKKIKASNRGCFSYTYGGYSFTNSLNQDLQINILFYGEVLKLGE